VTLVREIADELLLLCVHRDHWRVPRLIRLDAIVDALELRVPIGVLGAFARLLRGLKLVPIKNNSSPTFCALIGVPRSVSSAASLRVLFAVHLSGDSGSPRVTGSGCFRTAP
jgi:hypothetical protein